MKVSSSSNDADHREDKQKGKQNGIAFLKKI